MKKAILFLILLAQAASGYSQAYIPFPSSNAIWLVRHGNGEAWPDYYYYGLTNEDTTISGVTYHKLFRSVDTNFTSSEYYGGIREDLAAHKVYFYYGGSEKLLFDFSVNVADTVRSLNAVVHAVDSILIGSVYHRQIHFRMYNDTAAWHAGTWVEGIGNYPQGGIFGSLTAVPTCDCADVTLCFKQGGSWLYHNPLYSSIDCDNTPEDVGIISGKSGQPVIYPNPVNGSSRIVFNTNDGYFKMDIYNVTGRLIRSFTITNTMSEIKLNSSEYQPGSYYYHLYSHTSGAVSGKFVVK
jgi:Secretion system C-terminal sorting domain